MKWVLVNKFDEIVDICEIASNVGVSGAKTYFRKRKEIDEESFDKLWKVMSDEQYKRIMESWWKDEWSNPDIDVVEDNK